MKNKFIVRQWFPLSKEDGHHMYISKDKVSGYVFVNSEQMAASFNINQGDDVVWKAVASAFKKITDEDKETFGSLNLIPTESAKDIRNKMPKDDGSYEVDGIITRNEPVYR